MAKSNSLLLQGLSGQLGKQIVIKQYRGQPVITKYPDMSNRKFSPRQKQLQETMAAANNRAKNILGNKQSRMEAQLRLDVPSNKLYTALIKEYFTEVWPTIQPPVERK